MKNNDYSINYKLLEHLDKSLKSHYTHLHLTNMHISDQDLQSLTSAIDNFTVIYSINLSNNCITGDNLDNLKNLLIKLLEFPCLKHINLKGNTLSTKATILIQDSQIYKPIKISINNTKLSSSNHTDSDIIWFVCEPDEDYNTAVLGDNSVGHSEIEPDGSTCIWWIIFEHN